MNLSKNLTLKEVIKSNTARRKGIDNSATGKHLENLVVTANQVFQPIREHFGVPIGVSSGYRSPDLNTAVRGSKTSQHCKGQALDLDADMHGGVTNKQIFQFIRDNLQFTQLIWEYGDETEPNWVHVGYDPNNLKNQILIAYYDKEAGKTKYKNY